MFEQISEITKQDESRSETIARIVSQLPEREQDKIYYTIKGIELAGTDKEKHTAKGAVGL